jgi:hypothetical protein
VIRTLILISLNLLLLPPALVQGQQERVARVTYEQGSPRWWTTDHVMTRHHMAGGFDSVVYTDNYGDTSVHVWRFEPPNWMFELVESKNQLHEERFKWQNFQPGFFGQTELIESPGTVKRTEFFQHSPMESHRKFRITVKKIDPSTYQTLWEVDSTFDEAGRLREIVIDSNIASIDEIGYVWRQRRHKYSYHGRIGWIEHYNYLGTDTRLTRDSSGNEILVQYSTPSLSWRKMLTLPDGYDPLALAFGQKFDSIVSDPARDTQISTSLVWSKLPSPEMVEMFGVPFYSRADSFISTFVRTHTSRFGDRARTELDTFDVRIDDTGRLRFQKSYQGSTDYEYSTDGWLERMQTRSHDMRVRTLKLFRNSAGQLVAKQFLEATVDRDSSVDSAWSRCLLDYEYPTFRHFDRSLSIDDIATTLGRFDSLTVSVRDEWKPRVTAELLNLDGSSLGRSTSGTLNIANLPDGIYQVRYFLDGNVMYLQTIAIDVR